MSWCESVLRDHVTCVKGFLRDCRENDWTYEPGTYGSNDKCGTTRQDYVDCAHGPKPSQEMWGKGRRVDVVQHQGHYNVNKLTESGGMPSAGNVTRTQSQMPKPCDAELNMLGKCVETNLRKAIASGDQYIFLTDVKSGSDKCFLARTVFDQCMKEFKEEGWNKGTGGRMHQSTKLARSFSVRGRFVELE